MLDNIMPSIKKIKTAKSSYSTEVMMQPFLIVLNLHIKFSQCDSMATFKGWMNGANTTGFI